MDFNNVTSSFIDLKKNAQQVGELGAKFTDMWVRYMYDTMMAVMTNLADKSEDDAKQAFLDAIETAKENSKKMITELSEMSAQQVGDAYNIGFNEGSKMANDLNSKTMRKLIADGALDDPDGKIESYLKVADRVHQQAFHEMMQGRTLNLYQHKSDKKD